MQTKLSLGQRRCLLAYDFVLLALLAFGSWLGTRVSQPAARGGFAAACAQAAQGGGVWTGLLAAALFPLLSYLAGLLRAGVVLCGALALARGFVFGYSFSLYFGHMGFPAALVLVLREGLLLSMLFSVCNVSLIRRFSRRAVSERGLLAFAAVVLALYALTLI